MKVIFVQRDCLLRASGHDPEKLSGDLAPSDSALAALQALADTALPIILVGRDTVPVSDESEERNDRSLIRRMAKWMSEAESPVPVEALLICSHPPGTDCACWGPQPGYLYVADVALETRLNESYFLADTLLDVNMAYAGGCRPMLILAGRSIGAIFGDQPEHKDIPIAVDLQRAAGYIQEEERITEENGTPRATVTPALDTEYFEAAKKLPDAVPLSARAQARHARRSRPKLAPAELRRMMLAVVAGGVGLSLGIAYILVHLYREQPFPEWVRYVTLQFIPRQIRGLIFILFGAVVLGVTLWSVYRGMTNNRQSREKATRE